MNNQNWKHDKKLYNAPTIKENNQITKQLDYDTDYRDNFLECDPLRDWESINRCKFLWKWSVEKVLDEFENYYITNCSVLDCGTKDCQFPEWLVKNGISAIGLEYSKSYVEYATKKERPIRYGNVCDMEFDDNTFDFVFSHHLHGLLPDYLKGLQEMYRVSKKYMICLNHVPGNPKKHYSYIDSPQIFYDFIKSVNCEVLYNDYLDTGFENEWVLFLEKK